MNLRLLAVLLLLSHGESSTLDMTAGERAVTGTHACAGGGGPGTFVEVAVHGCTRIPCVMYAGSTYEFALTFKPTVTTGNLYLTLLESIVGPDSLVARVYQPGTYVAGSQYRVALSLTIPTNWRGEGGYFALYSHVGETTAWSSAQVCRIILSDIAGAKEEEQA